MTLQTSSAIAPGSSTAHPSDPPVTGPPPPAAEVVDHFLQGLRRRDLGALAALLSVDGHPDERTARDGAQAVLRSMGGSGFVAAELHPSTDGSTVFVDFRRDRPDLGAPGSRLLRFTTGAGAITAIREYYDGSCGDPAPPVPRSRDAGAAPVDPVAGVVDWPSLNEDRAARRARGR